MEIPPTDPKLEAALSQASDELGLQPWYRDCVKPLLRMPARQWPRCCGRGCEPCANTLNAVANRVQTLLAAAECSELGCSRRDRSD